MVAGAASVLAGCYAYQSADLIVSSVVGEETSVNEPLHIRLDATTEMTVGVQASYVISSGCVGGLVVPLDFKGGRTGNAPSNVIHIIVMPHVDAITLDFDKLALTYRGNRYSVDQVKLAVGLKDVGHQVVAGSDVERREYLLLFPQEIDARERFALSLDGFASKGDTSLHVGDVSFAPKTIHVRHNNGEAGC